MTFCKQIDDNLENYIRESLIPEKYLVPAGSVKNFNNAMQAARRM